MASAMPWSVRGIDPDIREQAVEAAHRSGMSVGQWLNQILAGNLDESESEDEIASSRHKHPRRKSERQHEPSSFQAPSRFQNHSGFDEQSRMDSLGERLERLAKPGMQTAAHRISGKNDANSPVLGLIEQAVQAIERLEAGHTSRALPMNTPRPPREMAHQDNGDDLGPVLKRLESRLAALNGQTQGDQNPEARLDDRLSTLLEALERVQPSQRNIVDVTRKGGTGQRQARAARLVGDDDPAFTQALAEIEARRRDLDLAQNGQAARPVSRLGAAAVPMRAADEVRHDQTQHFDAMRQQLDQLVARIDDMRSAPKPDNTRLQERLDQIAGRIDDMRAAPKPDNSRLQDRLDQIAGRLDDWRARPNEDVALIRRDLASLAAAIETLSPQRLVGMVEHAVAGIAEKSIRAQQEFLPARLLGPIERMQDDIRDVLREVASSRVSDRLTEEIGVVARRLDQIGQGAPDLSRIDDIMRETDAIKSLIGQAMHAQPLEGLTHQIMALGQQIERYRPDPRGADDSNILDSIHDIRERIERIDPNATFAGIETRLSAISAIEARLGAISGIEEKLGEIARDVSKLAQDSQPFPQLETIAARLERIDRVLDHNRDQPLAGLDHLAEKLDRIGVSLDKAALEKNVPPPPAPSQDALVGMLERLSERMDHAQSAQSDQSSLDALQDEIARLSKRMEQNPTAMPGLDGIERSVSDLFAQFDLARKDMRDVAESAAEKAAREAIRSMARDSGTDTLAAEGLLLIKRDLGEFKSAQSEAEKRTRQTLEALHGTLESLVTRLSQMETAPAPRREENTPRKEEAQRPALQANPTPLANPALQANMTQPSLGAAPMRAPVSKVSHGGPTASPSPASDFSDLPLEPGERPGQRVDGARAQASSPEAPVMTADPRTNFIAAARRAAQAAADRSQAVLADEPTDKKSRKAAKNLLAESADKAAQPQSLLARSRKPMLLGLAALVFALGAVKVLTTRDAAPQADIVMPELQTNPMSSPDKTPPSGKVEQRSETPLSTQPLPPNSIPIPGLSSDKSGPSALAPFPAGDKRAQRLSDASAISQADPMSVGSIQPDGAARPIETGREALSELVSQSNLKGQDRLKEAALTGNPAALFDIGTRYADGKGVTRDAKIAARWFEQAAAGGHAPSQYRLASLYREGRGVAKDPVIAFQWFDRAAAQGHVLAMHNAAVLLAEGVHGAPDYAGAALWFKRAAEHGVKDSQFNVAILFARGLGVNQDLVESFHWLSAAAAQGDQDAIKKRDDIAARLTKEQLTKERERLKNFVPMKPIAAANEGGNWDVAAPRPAATAPKSTRVN